ncbi:hypothetical protein MTP99_011007 [Tenebrio molitor]|nr:hypothetical protein MTP99_011007 [Tenebrio molitor]
MFSKYHVSCRLIRQQMEGQYVITTTINMTKLVVASATSEAEWVIKRKEKKMKRKVTHLRHRTVDGDGWLFLHLL